MPLLLLVGLALAEPCNLDASLTTLRGGEGDAKEAYLCLASLDRAAPLLVDAIDAATAPPTGELPAAPASVAPDEVGAVAVTVGASDAMTRARLSRALAVWFLSRPEVEWQPLQVARLAPADRRLVGDGIHARRGRKSPVADHVAVFEQLGWYTPNPRYSDNLLTTVDKGNLDAVEHPPPIPAAAPPALPEDADPRPAKARGGEGPPAGDGGPAKAACGCWTGRGAGGFVGVLLGVAPLLARRR